MAYCKNCGSQMEDGAQFCSNCGADQLPAQPPQIQQPVPPSSAQPVMQQPTAPKKRRVGCLVAVIIVVLIIAAGVFVFAKFAWLGPKNLGTKYDQDDLDSILSKLDLELTINGMDQEDSLEYLEDMKNEVIDEDDYEVVFTDYQEMSLEVTPEEMTAFANEIAAPFMRYEKFQTRINSDGTVACSYRVRFDQIKKEIIPDVAGSIPSQVSSLLPDRFNLYTEGSFEISENHFVVPQQLNRLDVGMVSLKPVIGDISDDQRDAVFGYADRLISQFPDVVVHSLKVNEEGNFDVSAYLPTVVTVNINQ